MKTHTHNGQTYGFVEVPEDAKNFKVKFDKKYPQYLVACTDRRGRRLHIRDHKAMTHEPEIIGLASELTEEQAKEMVNFNMVHTTTYYSNYMDKGSMDFRDIIDNSFLTAKESLITLVESFGMKPETTLIIKLK